MLKYKCLVLDHDDTVVRSTPEIHYPSFLKTLEVLRPDERVTLEEFILHSFDPGFISMCNDHFQFTEEEMDFEVRTWRDYVSQHIPKIYEGFDQIIHQQKKEGGLVCVVSHSCSDYIERDYKKNFGIVPDMIFGWELGEEQRKPNPYPLEEIMSTYDLVPSDLIMVDDLKPGFDMAKKCNVEFACAGWSNQIPRIAEYMKQNCNNYFDKVHKLEKFLFS